MVLLPLLVIMAPPLHAWLGKLAMNFHDRMLRNAEKHGRMPPLSNAEKHAWLGKLAMNNHDRMAPLSDAGKLTMSNHDRMPPLSNAEKHAWLGKLTMNHHDRMPPLSDAGKHT